MIRWLLGRGSQRGNGTGATVAPEFVALTDVGVKRNENQDAVLAKRLPDARLLLAVADGVGGSDGGAAASQLAVGWLEWGVSTTADAAAGLSKAYASADEAVDGLGSGKRKPATTLVAALVDGPQVWIANVGDSRAWIMGDGGLRQLTEDHSWVADQVRAGRLTPEEARTSQMRNVITRAIGTGDTAAPDLTGPLTLTPGETLVLTSDGLHGLLSEAEIAAVIASDELEDAARRLIQMANDAGGPDNISVVIYRAP